MMKAGTDKGADAHMGVLGAMCTFCRDLGEAIAALA